ncbi:MAG: hypothetical protein V9F04_00300 [Dermatophilaceae bacterium]
MGRHPRRDRVGDPGTRAAVVIGSIGVTAVLLVCAAWWYVAGLPAKRMQAALRDPTPAAGALPSAGATAPDLAPAFIVPTPSFATPSLTAPLGPLEPELPPDVTAPVGRPARTSSRSCTGSRAGSCASTHAQTHRETPQRSRHGDRGPAHLRTAEQACPRDLELRVVGPGLRHPRRRHPQRHFGGLGTGVDVGDRAGARRLGHVFGESQRRQLRPHPREIAVVSATSDAEAS